MKIALIGYGKMGHTIEQIALERGHQIVLRITSANRAALDGPDLEKADVAIEFTTPAAAKENILKCFHTGIPVVSGTTGWNTSLPEVKKIAIDKGAAFLQSSNFSIGVNIFFEINKVLARMMDHYPDYKITIEETHHTAKKDAPSGTAITLAEQIIEQLKRKESWQKGPLVNEGTIPVISHRIEEVPGTHSVKYSSLIDDIDIIHTAHNRKGFALGAVLAAEFIAGKKGVFEMKNVLGIK